MSGWLIRLLLFALLVTLLVRSVWRFLVGVVEGGTGPARRRVPEKSGSLVRDPVCGTFVLPARALTSREGDTTRYFCSERCRDEYARSR